MSWWKRDKPAVMTSSADKAGPQPGARRTRRTRRAQGFFVRSASAQLASTHNVLTTKSHGVPATRQSYKPLHLAFPSSSDRSSPSSHAKVAIFAKIIAEAGSRAPSTRHVSVCLLAQHLVGKVPPPLPFVPASPITRLYLGGVTVAPSTCTAYLFRNFSPSTSFRVPRKRSQLSSVLFPLLPRARPHTCRKPLSIEGDWGAVRDTAHGSQTLEHAWTLMHSTGAGHPRLSRAKILDIFRFSGNYLSTATSYAVSLFCKESRLCSRNTFLAPALRCWSCLAR